MAEKSLIGELSEGIMRAFYKGRVNEAQWWATFFPLEEIDDLTYTTLIGRQGNRVAANVISYDSAAPEHARKVVEKLTGDIPKIAAKRRMSEKNLLKYGRLKKQTDSTKSQLVALIYDDLAFVKDAVLSRMEWLALTAISSTQIVLDKSVNAKGIVLESAIDFQMPAANKLATASGTDAITVANKATSKPITWFRTIQKAAKKTGGVTIALMNTDSFDAVIASQETIDFLKVYGGVQSSLTVPSQNVEFVNAALKAARLPQIVVIDTAVDIENEDGTYATVDPFNSNYITFIPETNLGNFLNGPVAEDLFPTKQFTTIKDGNVLISKYGEGDPKKELTLGQSNCFPSWDNVDSCYSLDRTSTTGTWAVK